MSIREIIQWACHEGTLVEIHPLRPGDQPRVIFAVKELVDEINAGAEAPEGSDAFRIGQLRGDLDHFSLGGIITAEKTDA